MASRGNEYQRKCVVLDAIHEQPIAVDMQFAISLKVPSESMIAVMSDEHAPVSRHKVLYCRFQEVEVVMLASQLLHLSQK